MRDTFVRKKQKPLIPKTSCAVWDSLNDSIKKGTKPGSQANAPLTPYALKTLSTMNYWSKVMQDRHWSEWSEWERVVVLWPQETIGGQRKVGHLYRRQRSHRLHKKRQDQFATGKELFRLRLKGEI